VTLAVAILVAGRRGRHSRRYTPAMPRPTLAGKLVVAISSRALFDLSESHRIYTEAGVDAYHRYQVEHEDEILAPGSAFVLVKKLLRLNRPDKQYVEVILLSRNSADTGLRVFNSIKHYGLDITRAAFTKGEPTSRYVPAFGAHLFLSADTGDVRRALDDGHAAATIVPSATGGNEADELRIAFDGDAVLFSDEAERIYQEEGLAAFARSETVAAMQPLSGGPFKEFLAGLHRIQAEFAEDKSPIRTALVTARSAPAHERVIRTLRAWNIRIDEALFLGGLDKGEFLRAFRADIFFDDQRTHVESAAQHVAAGHVPHGIVNAR
jgi:5'-nucleotidase